MSAEVLLRAATDLRAAVDGLDGHTITKADVRSVWLNSRQHLVLKPTVALALADWLDSHAKDCDDSGNGPDLPAVAVARACIGADA